jgi:hypothetical protein
MSRPYKCHYFNRHGRLVARVAACGSPEGVIRSACVRVLRGEAVSVEIRVDGTPIGWIERIAGEIHFHLPRP